MPSDKRNSIMAMATGFNFSLINVTLSGDVPFHPVQQLQCLHHGSTKDYLCSPLSSIFSPLPRRWQFAICVLWLRCETRVSIGLAGVFLMLLFFAWNVAKHVRRVRSKTKCNNTPESSDTPTFKSINEACAEHSVFSVMAGLIADTFHAFLHLFAV